MCAWKPSDGHDKGPRSPQKQLPVAKDGATAATTSARWQWVIIHRAEETSVSPFGTGYRTDEHMRRRDESAQNSK